MNANLHLPTFPWLNLQWPVAWRRSPSRTSPTADEADTLDALRELSDHTLNDIGVPDALQWRAHARREAERRCRDELHLGVAAGSWRHW